ncbi:MAG: RNA polymerase sigma factor [Flavobacteriales bacterium]
MSTDFYLQYIVPHSGIIIKICRAYTNTSEDFEDYYQEVCLQIWRSRDGFQSQSEWSTWVYRVSLNVCLTLLKKKTNRNQEFASDYFPQAFHDDVNAFDNDDLAELYNAIRQLSEINRAIILLYLEEKPYEVIANIIGLSANNIGVRIKRIKQQLKTLLHGKIN